jgi:hypothetical protein
MLDEPSAGLHQPPQQAGQPPLPDPRGQRQTIRSEAGSIPLDKLTNVAVLEQRSQCRLIILGRALYAHLLN